MTQWLLKFLALNLHLASFPCSIREAYVRHLCQPYLDIRVHVLKECKHAIREHTSKLDDNLSCQPVWSSLLSLAVSLKCSSCSSSSGSTKLLKCHHWCCLPTLLTDKRRPKSNFPYLGNKRFGRSWAHEQHSSAQCIPIAMQLLHTHCSEQTRDHHVNVGFHFLKGYIHPLLRGTVKEILNATDIWKKKIDRGVTVQNNNHILLKASCRKITQDCTGHKYQTSEALEASLITLHHILSFSWWIISLQE